MEKSNNQNPILSVEDYEKMYDPETVLQAGRDFQNKRDFKNFPITDLGGYGAELKKTKPEKGPKAISALIASVNRRRMVGARTSSAAYTTADLKELFFAFRNKRCPEFKVNSNNKMAIGFFIQYILGIESPEFYDLRKGIALVGPKGIGKTTIMEIFSDMLGLLRHQENCFNETAFKFANLDTQVKLCGDLGKLEPVLKMGKENYCWDDIGREDLLVNQFGNNSAPLQALVNFAYQNFKRKGVLFFATSNLTYPEIMARYDERTGELLGEMFNFIHITDQNHRI